MAASPAKTRRAPRVPARCPAEVAFGAGRWVGLTEDLGAGGCRIVARLALRPGEPLSLKLRYSGVDFALEIVGTVAWTAPRPPWRAGVAFARGQEEKARRFVRAVLSASPALAPQGASGGIRTPPPMVYAPAPLPAQAILAYRAEEAQALVALARSQAAAGNSTDAVRKLRAALELDPENAEAIQGLRAMGVVDA